MEVHLVADTNLFFECRELESLPWHELGRDPIIILLTKPVLDEIDGHKRSSGRTRTRAIAIFSRVRKMLASSLQDDVIRESSPKVILRRKANVVANPALKEVLDYSKTDEKLIGITVPIRLSQTPTTCGVDPCSRIKLGIGWRLGAA
ncbi:MULTISPECIES: hypothetical protein, partial [unclassified Acidiphilium]